MWKTNGICLKQQRSSQCWGSIRKRQSEWKTKDDQEWFLCNTWVFFKGSVSWLDFCLCNKNSYKLLSGRGQKMSYSARSMNKPQFSKGITPPWWIQCAEQRWSRSVQIFPFSSPRQPFCKEQTFRRGEVFNPGLRLCPASGWIQFPSAPFSVPKVKGMWTPGFRLGLKSATQQDLKNEGRGCFVCDALKASVCGG